MAAVPAAAALAPPSGGTGSASAKERASLVAKTRWRLRDESAVTKASANNNLARRSCGRLRGRARQQCRRLRARSCGRLRGGGGGERARQQCRCRGSLGVVSRGSQSVLFGVDLGKVQATGACEVRDFHRCALAGAGSARDFGAALGILFSSGSCAKPRPQAPHAARSLPHLQKSAGAGAAPIGGAPPALALALLEAPAPEAAAVAARVTECDSVMSTKTAAMVCMSEAEEGMRGCHHTLRRCAAVEFTVTPHCILAPVAASPIFKL
jgi:hypothetical protein